MLQGKIKSKKASKRAIVIIPTVVLSLLAIVCIVSFYISRSKELPDISSETLDKVYEEYDLNNTPDMTMELMEYTDSLEEGGIIK